MSVLCRLRSSCSFLIAVSLGLMMTGCGSSSNDLGSPTPGDGGGNDGGSAGGGDNSGGGDSGGGGDTGGGDSGTPTLSLAATYEIDFGDSVLAGGRFELDSSGGATGTATTLEGDYLINGSMTSTTLLRITGFEDHTASDIGSNHAIELPPLLLDLDINEDRTAFEGTYELGVLEGDITFDRHNDHQGSHSGIYGGTDSGTWSLTISKWGNVSGTMTSSLAAEERTLAGSVDHFGVVSITIDGADSFTGTIDGTESWVGSWTDGESSGTFSSDTSEAASLLADG